MAEHSRSTAMYYGIFAALIVLTLLTIGISFLELGAWHTIVGLVIASAKALLVVLFFMHVIESTRLTWVVVASGLLWLGILIGYTLTDYMTRAWQT